MLGVFVLVIVVLLWALVAGRMATLSITTAIAIVVVGMILTAGSNPVIRIDLDTKIVERGVELTLAMLLFLDATEVRGGIMRRERRVLLRLLAIALPLSLLIAWLVGLALFPPREAWLLAVLAIIVVPVDLAPAVAIVRDPRVPTRLREIMNVEAGLNDGLAAPLFLFCLAGATATHTPAVEALENAVPAILIAVGVGGAIGLAGGVSLGWSWPIRWRSRSGVTASWRRSPRACCSPPAIAASRRRRCTPPRT